MRNNSHAFFGADFLTTPKHVIFQAKKWVSGVEKGGRYISHAVGVTPLFNSEFFRELADERCISHGLALQLSREAWKRLATERCKTPRKGKFSPYDQWVTKLPCSFLPVSPIEILPERLIGRLEKRGKRIRKSPSDPDRATLQLSPQFGSPPDISHCGRPLYVSDHKNCFGGQIELPLRRAFTHSC